MKPVIAGVDEAGRGALAGPVVAAAVILKPNTKTQFFDSKQISQKERERLYEDIIHNYDFGVGIVDAEYIDAYGIKKATNKAMQEAVNALKTKPNSLLVDGRDRFQFSIPSTDIIHGDAIEPCISAASIIAKVERDQYMTKVSKMYPEFQFEDHKGYGTEFHRDLLEKGAITPLHRKTYEPLQTLLTQMRLF